VDKPRVIEVLYNARGAGRIEKSKILYITISDLRSGPFRSYGPVLFVPFGPMEVLAKCKEIAKPP